MYVVVIDDIVVTIVVVVVVDALGRCGVYAVIIIDRLNLLPSDSISISPR